MAYVGEEKREGNSFNIPDEQTSSCCTSGDFSRMPSNPDSTGASRIGESSSTDTFIADALQDLSLEDRDTVYHEIHGIVDIVEETEELVKESFVSLRSELFKLATKNAGAKSFLMDVEPFRKAEQTNFEYVHSKFHYLMVLRAERFMDSRKSAERLIYFFQLKSMLFGDHNLCVDIHQGMLSKNDLVYLKRGFMQVRPSRDRSGRVVADHFFYLIDCDDNLTLGRVYFYGAWLLALDVETQRKGYVLVQWATDRKGESHKMNVGLYKLHAIITLGSPARLVVCHNCFSEQIYKVFLSWTLKLSTQDVRARVKLHFGTTQECVYSLLSYGISAEGLPVSSTEGEVKTKRHRDWLRANATQEQRAIEGRLRPITSNGAAHLWVSIPETTDVLLGKGRNSPSHDGNTKLVKLINEHLREYNECRKGGKTEIVAKIIRIVQTDGRFLIQDNDGVWVHAEEDEVKMRVSQRFRTVQYQKAAKGGGDQASKRPPATQLFSDFASLPKRAKADT